MAHNQLFEEVPQNILDFEFWRQKAMTHLEVVNPTSPSWTQTSDLAGTIGHCYQLYDVWVGQNRNGQDQSMWFACTGTVACFDATQMGMLGQYAEHFPIKIVDRTIVSFDGLHIQKLWFQ